jgi:hypothetical protein
VALGHLDLRVATASGCRPRSPRAG